MVIHTGALILNVVTLECPLKGQLLAGTVDYFIFFFPVKFSNPSICIGSSYQFLL